jgi:hypothetical protein
MNYAFQPSEPKVKNEPPDEFDSKIQALENLSDRCYEHLNLIQRPWNLGVWLSLAHSIKMIHGAELRFPLSAERHLRAIQNVGSFARQMMHWCVNHGSRPDLPLSRFCVTKDYWEDVQRAFEIALNYEQFCRILPRWHRYMEAAELISSDEIRFTHVLSGLPRRVLAYQANMRPPGGRPKPTYEPVDRRLEQLVSEIQGTVRRRQRHIKVDRLRDLRTAAFQTYVDNPAPIVQMFRRNSDVNVGGYTLGDFQLFYTALIAVMATHEQLCTLWKNDPSKIPFISTVLTHSPSEWGRVIRSLTNQSKGIVEAIIADLTYGAIRKRDPMLSPFIPVNTAQTQLAVAFPCVLASAAEDNILRVCSHLRPSIFNLTTNAKEEEMRRTLRESASEELDIVGPVHLSERVPDVDVIIENKKAGVVVIAEAKWLATRQDGELLKGVSQCKKIREFLKTNDDFLFRRKQISRKLSEFRRVVFCVIARDYLIYNDPKDVPVIAFDAVLKALKMANIDAGVDFLMSFDWLPLEDRDFRMTRNIAKVPGVTISYEGYRRTYTDPSDRTVAAI